jgi:hypothetical protein
MTLSLGELVKNIAFVFPCCMRTYQVVSQKLQGRVWGYGSGIVHLDAAPQFTTPYINMANPLRTTTPQHSSSFIEANVDLPSDPEPTFQRGRHGRLARPPFI